jgi:hypothetical protein
LQFYILNSEAHIARSFSEQTLWLTELAAPKRGFCRPVNQKDMVILTFMPRHCEVFGILPDNKLVCKTNEDWVLDMLSSIKTHLRIKAKPLQEA